MNVTSYKYDKNCHDLQLKINLLFIISDISYSKYLLLSLYRYNHLPIGMEAKFSALDAEILDASIEKSKDSCKQ